MAISIFSRLSQYERFDEVTKLVQTGFYKPGDFCDLPLSCPDLWSEFGSSWNVEVCNPLNLEIRDEGNGTWKFRAFL